MSKTKLITAAMSAFLALSGGNLALAQRGTGNQGGPGFGSGPRGSGVEGGPSHRGGLFPFLARALDLTDEQRTQIREILEQERAQRAESRDETGQALKAVQEAIREATLAPEFSEGALRELYAQRSALLEQGFIERQRTMHQVFQVLTPEQQEKARDLLGDMPDFEGPMRPGRRSGF